MRRRAVRAVLIFMSALVMALPAWAQQKPFTQEQVQGLVKNGVGDESGAKLIEQRGIDFVPSEDFLQNLKAAGANEAFLAALRAAKRPQPTGEEARNSLSQVQGISLLAGQGPSHRVAMAAQQLGIEFEVTDDWFQQVRLAGGNEELISALEAAKVTNPERTDPALQARQAQIRQHVARGIGLMGEKHYADAEAEFRAAVVLGPQNASLHAGLGWALGEKGDVDGAIAEYREALRLNPKNENAHVGLGVALGQKGDWDGVIAEEREALRLNPKNENAHVNLGVALVAKGDLDGAIAEYREALRLNPKNENVHVNIGVALGIKGDWDGETAEEREVLRLNPKSEWAHYYLGLALGNKGDWDGEIAEEREALRLNPNNPQTHFALGAGLEQKGDRKSALQEYRAAFELNPKVPGYRQAYQRLLQRQNK